MVEIYIRIQSLASRLLKLEVGVSGGPSGITSWIVDPTTIKLPQVSFLFIFDYLQHAL
jgi:hypothetical protein